MADSPPGNASPPKSGWVKDSIKRSPSYLGMALKEFTAHDTRNLYEKHSVPFQCEVVLGPVGKNRTCWLCGFPIAHLTSLKDAAGNRIFQMPIVGGQENTVMDRGVCEHVLPVKLGHGILELLYLTKDPTYEKLLHTEYEYAHNFCNMYKSDEYFVTLPEDSTNFCDLDIKEEVLDEVLRRIFYTRRGSKGSKQSSLVTARHKGQVLEFPNPVQAYCFSTNTAEFLADPDKFYREKWFPKTKAMILEKMNRVIAYVKEADNCEANNNTKGSHFRGFETRLREGVPALPRGLKGPSLETLEEKNPVEFERVGRLQRSPSFNEILAAHTNTRLVPFRSPSFSGYAVNMANSPRSRPSSRGSRGKSKSPAAVEEAANVRAAGMNALALTFAEEVAKPKALLKRQLASRRLVRRANNNNNNNNYTSSNTNSNSNSNNARDATRKARNRARNRAAPAAAAAAANEPRIQTLGKGLRAETKENGIYISGRTFNSKNLLKTLGASWNPAEKKWVLPLATNLSPLL
jgi:hypothetical protein